ncbi:MAG: hypothetical protein K6F33_02375 [Bacteroidales bacterium]|nr:hypothetical protein [Bacteroidales bacterium]
MKKNILIIAAAAIALSVCGINGGPQKAYSMAVETQSEPQTSFHYVEPQEEIAKIIWAKIQDTYPYVKSKVSEAPGCQNFLSKTGMLFNHVGKNAEGRIEHLAYYQLQCYQNNDNTWTAALFCVADNGDGDFRSFRYANGTLTENTSETNIPKFQDQLFDFATTYRDCVVDFDTDGFSMIANTYWPQRYNWDGSKFVPDAKNVVVSAQIQRYGCVVSCEIGTPIKSSVTYAVSWVSISRNVVRSTKNGEKLFEVETEKKNVTAFNILSPHIGFVQTEEPCGKPYTSSEMMRVTSKPIAIGQPIKNVLDYKPVEKEPKDTAIAIEKKDGMYTITQHLYRNMDEKYDVFISFAAQDENSNIEKIRMYLVPSDIALESEMEDTK